MIKTLIVDARKCSGCRTCEAYCSLKHEGYSCPSKGRIHVVKWEREGIFVPINCMRCQEPSCEMVCPKREPIAIILLELWPWTPIAASVA